MILEDGKEGLGLGWEEQLCNEAGITNGKLPPSAILSFIDSSGAFSIHAKTCRK